MNLIKFLAACLLSVPVLSGCGEETLEGGSENGNGVQRNPVAVTLTQSQARDVRVELFSVGRIISKSTPRLAAEIDARVIEISVTEGRSVVKGEVLIRLDATTYELSKREAEAAITRLNASIANEERRVARYRGLKTKDMMSQERLDDAEAQLAVDRATLVGAQARLAIAADRLTKTELVSPVNGVVERRHVSVGDFVSVGSPLLTVVDTVALRAELPFPETVGHLVKVGQAIFLESAIAPGLVVEATVDQIRPQVGSMTRSLMVMVELVNPGSWRPEATIEAYLVVENRRGAIVVPASSVVKRPAGEVIFLLDTPTGEQVSQSVVTTGVRKDDWVEIRDGLSVDAYVVVEGAHYLSDGARVVAQESAQ